MPPFDDVPGVDTTGSEMLVVNVASDTADGYDRGDVVVVRPAGWPWGTQEDPETRTNEPTDKFVILQVPGRAFEQTRGLGRPWREGTPADPDLQSKSLHSVDLDSLPQPVRDDLDATGKATVGWGQVSAGHITRQDTGEAVADLEVI